MSIAYDSFNFVLIFPSQNTNKLVYGKIKRTGIGIAFAGKSDTPRFFKIYNTALPEEYITANTRAIHAQTGGTMKRKSSASRKKTELPEIYVKCSGIQRLPALLLLLSFLTAAVSACGKAPGLSDSAVDLTKKYRGGIEKNETVETGEDFARAYCEFSLGLLKDAIGSESQNSKAQNNEAQNSGVQNSGVQNSDAQNNDAQNSEEETSGAQSDASPNLMISPISVLQALEMTRIGAGSETLEQMSMTMYPGMEAEQGRKQLLSWAEGLPSADDAAMKLANSVWINTENEQFHPDDEFLKRNALESRASVYGAPFDEAACKALNQWVEQNTDGMVKDILDRIPREAIMYLVNAAAFDAKWKEPYTSNQVGKGIFAKEEGSESEVPMMYSMESVFLQGEHAVGFCKPYASGYYFAAILPEEGWTLQEYIRQLDGEALRQMLTSPAEAAVEAALPKFKGESSRELSGTLSGMGMPLAFDSGFADFSGMGSCEGGNICISRVLHKTYIEVDELGTKAGAATVVEMEAGGAFMVTESVILNRPFLYAIVDEKTDLPIFIGIVEDPATE